MLELSIEDGNLLYMSAAQSLLERVLWTGWLVDEKPVSLLLIAKPESGKTVMIEKFIKNEGVFYLTDVTAYGIIKGVYPLIKTGRPITHIVIPDLLNPLSKQQHTSRAFIQFMNSLVEEGIVEVQNYFVQERFEGLNCGLISSITEDGFLTHLKKWRRIGFTSRLLPFSYSYNVKSTSEILRSIVKVEYHSEAQVILNLPAAKQKIVDRPDLYDQLVPFSIRLAESEGLYGFRYQKQFQTLAKANALAEGRSEVNQSDIDWVMAVAEWINYDYKPIVDRKFHSEVKEVKNSS